MEPVSSFPENLESSLRGPLSAGPLRLDLFINTRCASSDFCPMVCGGKKTGMQLEKGKERIENEKGSSDNIPVLS